MRRMGWSWEQYLATPQYVIEMVILEMSAEGKAARLRQEWKET